MTKSYNELFEPAIEYPNVDYRSRLDALVGLDDYKNRLAKILGLLINPDGIENWVKKFHPEATKVRETVLRRPPLVILEGDVGAGKTELALTIGDWVARQEKIDITLFPLSLSTRGQGLVGEMTGLISDAFDLTITKAEKLKNQNGSSRGAVILLVDEADALSQSRENNQMHHEDKAGVNAFIRGIDRIGNGKLPAAVIMCTNRLSSVDPAVKRRAADILTFQRPNDEQRHFVLKNNLDELGIVEATLSDLVKLTGPTEDRDYGFTFSDIIQRLIPTIILDAYPNTPVIPERVIEISRSILPTPPFKEA